MRIGVFGGCFDPIHSAHLEIAKQAIRELQLDKLILVVAGTSPNKVHAGTAPAKMRLEMAGIASKDVPGVEVCDWEARQDGLNYTAETLDALEEKYPGSEFFLIRYHGTCFFPQDSAKESGPSLQFRRENRLFSFVVYTANL